MLKLKKVERRIKKYVHHGQTAVEYMLLLAVVVAIVLTSFKLTIPRAYNYVNEYFNNVAPGILGRAPRCGDGICDNARNPPFETCEKCPVDCCPMP
ncbi:MAG: hypothetical protein K8S27_06550 [Candidatus Omnitrophica bacterium]|nr:hypothetical protein [Candidatus Omnitrophota bacterium]